MTQDLRALRDHGRQIGGGLVVEIIPVGGEGVLDWERLPVRIEWEAQR